MKNSFILLALFASLSLVGCKKNEKVSPIENPVTAVLKDTATVKMGQRSSGPWELGLAFSASVPGKITQVGSRMPQPGSYRILIWDFDSKALLRQKTVEQSSPGVLSVANLDEVLPLVADKKYVISINTQSAGVNKPYYYAYKTAGSFLPVSKGSILLHSAMYSSVSTAIFPSSTSSVAYEFYGIADFSFSPD